MGFLGSSASVLCQLSRQQKTIRCGYLWKQESSSLPGSILISRVYRSSEADPPFSREGLVRECWGYNGVQVSSWAVLSTLSSLL